MKKLIVFGVALLLTVGLVQAQEVTPCQQACLDRFVVEMDACDATFDQTMAQIEETFNQCEANAGADPQLLFACTRAKNFATARALRAQYRCHSFANLHAVACVQACGPIQRPAGGFWKIG